MLPQLYEVSDFKTRTSITAAIRPSSLKAVDTALGVYNASPTEEKLRQLYLKLRDYTHENGVNWDRDDLRNRNGAISVLWDRIQRGLFGDGVTPQYKFATRKEQDRFNAALPELKKLLRERHATVCDDIFGGTQLEFKTLGTIPGLSVKVPQVAGYSEIGFTALNAHSIYDGGEAIQQIINKAVQSFPDAAASLASEINAYLSWTGLPAQWVTEFSKAMPLIGVVSSGMSAVYNAIRAAYDEYKASVVKESSQVLLFGTPQAAVGSLQTLIDRDQTAHLTAAAQSALQCGTQAALMVLDPTQTAQGLVGLAAAVASISYRVFVIGRDIKEKNAANAILGGSKAITQTVFTAHPLLGCYFLAKADTASLIAFLGDFGNAGWMTNIEYTAKTYVAPLKEYSVRYIKDSRFILKKGEVPVYLESSLDTQGKVSSALSGMGPISRKLGFKNSLEQRAAEALSKPKKYSGYSNTEYLADRDAGAALAAARSSGGDVAAAQATYNTAHERVDADFARTQEDARAEQRLRDIMEALEEAGLA